MRAYPVVLFDLDGTLLDTVPMILESFRHVLAAHFPHPFTEAELADGIGTPLAAQFDHLQRLAGRPVDAAFTEHLTAAYIEHNLSIHDARVSAFPGVAEALDRLSARGARLAIVTSKAHRTAERGLRVCGLLHHFEGIVGREDVAQHKPHPEPVRAALRLLGEPPERAVFVGDSPYDLDSGRAAGTATAAALWGPFARERLAPSAPDHWLLSAADLV